MKKTKLFITILALTTSMSITAFAGTWKQDDTGWWYQNDDGGYPAKSWQIIDGKTYLFDSNGYMRTGWIQTETGKWYYLNPTGEIRYEDLSENGTTYHFDSQGFCTNPNGNDSSFNNDYQSIIDQERLEAEKRLSQQPTEEAYDEEVKYYHDVSPQPIKNRYGLSDI